MIGALGIALLSAAPVVSAGGGGGTNAETQALSARMTTPPDPARATLNDNLIGALKNGATSHSNIWAKLDIFYVMAAADSQAAALDWKNLGGAGAFNLATSAGAPTFTADRGFTVTNVDKLTTGFVPSTNGVQAVTTSTHLMGWSRTSAQPTSNAFVLGDAFRLGLQPRDTTDSMEARVCSTSTRSINSAGVTDGSGMFVATASTADNTKLQGYRNGAQIGTDFARTTSSAATTVQTIIGTGNPAYQWAAASWGAALSAAEILDFYNALNTYMAAIGAA